MLHIIEDLIFKNCIKLGHGNRKGASKSILDKVVLCRIRGCCRRSHRPVAQRLGTGVSLHRKRSRWGETFPDAEAFLSARPLHATPFGGSYLIEVSIWLLEAPLGIIIIIGPACCKI